MKKIVLPILFLILISVSCNLNKTNEETAVVSIIPQPVSVVQSSGIFEINEKTLVYLAQDDAGQGVADYLINYLGKSTGISIKITGSKKSSGSILFQLSDSEEYGKESYKLEVSKKEIVIEAGSEAGLFYGVQSLLQLLPVEVFSNKKVQRDNLEVPCCIINDSPRFAWRGMHLDVSRHFFDVDFIKRYIDLIAMHKMNVFHWHLTDDNGWRIEIKSYPKLTEISAWRVDRGNVHWREATPPEEGEKPTYGGFYTQEEIKEVIAYAADRHITVIPEIEMPGHTSEVFAAYPELSCTEGEFYVQPGSYWPNVDIFCAGKEEPFHFIEAVLTEVIDLFPSEYIHIGGDEANKTRWEECAKCQMRIKDENLADEHELQSWFIKRIEKFILAHNKKMIGWDEILEGGLAPEATVMSWRGMKGGIEAAKQGHDVIMSPTSHCYFDYYQANPDFEPVAIGGFLPLSKVYNFEPVPADLDDEQKKFILGAQGNVWTEYISTPEHAEYMSVPRMTALAEVVWSPEDRRNWNDFQKRLQVQFQRFSAMNLNYSSGSWAVNIQPGMVEDSFYIELSSDQYGVPIYYTLDGSVPSKQSYTYSDPIELTHSATIQAVMFKDDLLMEEPSVKEIVFHKGLGKKATLELLPNPYYPAKGALSIVDGLRGTDSHRDGYWLGFEGVDLNAEVDLGSMTEVSSVAVGCLQNSGAWIFMPKEVIISLFNEDKNLIIQSRIEPEATIEVKGTILEELGDTFEGVEARYVRVQANGYPSIPEWHEGAGNKAWIFVDEIVIH